MATPEPPADLVQLRRDYLQAEQHHTTGLCHTTPPGTEADEQQSAAVTEAFRTMADLAVRIAGHDWWAGAGNRVDAEALLRKTAAADATG